MAKGCTKPGEKSPAWIFIELFRPGINTAIERAIAYRERVSQFCQEVLDAAGAPGKPKSGLDGISVAPPVIPVEAEAKASVVSLK